MRPLSRAKVYETQHTLSCKHRLGTVMLITTLVTGCGGSDKETTGTVTTSPIDAVAFHMNPAHTGSVQFSSVSLPAKPEWSVNVGGNASYALIADGKVFVTVATSTALQIVALDQSTGAVVWGPIAVSSNAAYDSGTRFVGISASLEALDAGAGSSCGPLRYRTAHRHPPQPMEQCLSDPRAK